ncbi:hypothetical protein MNBD_GAMMA23-887 [hydrothermal vent metagenome]|uniref:LysM domain-containing protein n=1 Tax=hydrothermal vent metagenome TaxID=652676 RepID=A0A3B0ZS89_9ZZZZ
MKIVQRLKFLALMVVTLGLVIGCAGTTEDDTQPQGGAASAITAAEKAYKVALDELYAWRDTGKIIKKAKKALKAGNDAKAIKLANKAKKQAEDAVAQKYAELDRLKDILGHEEVKSSAAAGGYQVVSGDNLWDISAKAEIYSNPYQWPLIYKANKDQIKDADLIYPGQNLAIDQRASASDIDAAVNHAKTRGSWSIGVVESSDTDYLSK